jgi:hypothetical protein
MKLKPIKDGMVVNCKTEDEAKELVEWGHACGYDIILYNLWREYGNHTCFRFCQLKNGKKIINYCNTNFYLNNGYKVTEFSDLIVSEDEMREATKEEKHAVNDYINSISKQTGTNFYGKDEHMSAEEILEWIKNNFTNVDAYTEVFGCLCTYSVYLLILQQKKLFPKSKLTKQKRNRKKK